MTPDVLVVGGGPAGRALAADCARLGLCTTLLDPAPDAPWRATYGSFAAELPGGLPGHVIATRTRGHAIADARHDLGWEYAVLDVPVLRSELDAGLAGVSIRRGRAVGSPGPGVVALADGTVTRAAVVVDAGGSRRPLDGVRPRRAAAEQTAYGLIVGEATAAPLLATGEAMFMDWRADHGEAGWPTFLYAVALGRGAVLLEETSLARRPGLPMPVLRRRLLARLARHGIAPPTDAVDERVHFAVDTPRHRTRGVLGFGAAAPLVHPATGFSVAAALRLAPRVAAAIGTGLGTGPAAALAAACTAVWSTEARAVHRVRRIGLEALLRMPEREVSAFFEVFFRLPERHRWAYLTGRDDLAGTVGAMNALFASAGWVMRGRLVSPALRPPARAAADPEVAPIG